MIQYRVPIRKNTPQVIGPYTFKDETRTIISLAGFVSASLEIKHEGEIYETVTAEILTPATNGKVRYTPYTFDEVGVWELQFYAQDGSGAKVFGESIQVKVFPNVEDLSLDQIMTF